MWTSWYGREGAIAEADPDPGSLLRGTRAAVLNEMLKGIQTPGGPDALKGGEDVSSSAVMEIHVKKKEETKYTCGGGAGLKITRQRCRLVSSAHGGREERSN